MCGIFGLITPGRPVDTGACYRATQALAHRGPDGLGVALGRLDERSAHFQLNPPPELLPQSPEQQCDFFLGHRRLAVIDLAPQASQPMPNEDRTIWVVFNGEIYNHGQLRDRLAGCGHRFRTDHSDTEVLVHGYEQWAPLFGDEAPRLLAVRDVEPLALIVTELPGQPMQDVELTPVQERAVWRAAGRAVAALHESAVGERFGPCRRDGSHAGPAVRDAREFVGAQIRDGVERSERGGYMSDDECAIARAALDLIPAFEDEPAIPCHRDYCPLNWLVKEDGTWGGAIDFEFSRWDVRATDYTRYPDWDWMKRPDLPEAFFEGYGRGLTRREEQQRLVCHVRYAVSAIVCGHECGMLGFAREGYDALAYFSGQLR